MARCSRGSSLIELAAIAFFIPILAILCLNIVLLVYGAWVCDAACVSAARAAGQQATVEAAKNAARHALLPFAVGPGSPFTSPVVDDASFVYKNTDDQGNLLPLSEHPYVQVTTKMQASLPCPVIWCSNGFTGNVNFVQSYTYPILQNPGQSQNGP